MYLFFRRKFSWDDKGFGAYIGLFGILGIFAQYGLLPFMSNRLKLHDLTIGKPKRLEVKITNYLSFSIHCHHWCCSPANCHLLYSCIIPQMDPLPGWGPCCSKYLHHNCPKITHNKGDHRSKDSLNTFY